ncbi:capsule biosynthesis phosphatase [Xylogone sp. PMI_703]|nr:capsule biosynthesis phosphatase [Xylogone sp. PMI_703]
MLELTDNRIESKPSDALNVIVPIGGIGSRFAREGYRFPKPLINIVGKPMILWMIGNLSIKPDDTLWIAVNEEVDDEFRIGQLLLKSWPKLDFRLLRLRHQTKGASETLYIVSQSMGQGHLRRRTVSLDCDTIYWSDILQNIRNMPDGHGGCFYFPDDGNKPIFSYIQTETKNGLSLITDIREKVAISNKANTGAYVFPSASVLKSWAAKSIDMNSKRLDGSDVGEYYTSQMISNMILVGKVPFLGIGISKEDFSCVGTPEQLKDLLRQLKRGASAIKASTIKVEPRRFCFDLDSTLVGVPTVPGDYSTCPPITKNIELVQQLYKAGHYIIIQTARRMRTHKGNIGGVIADIGPVTFAQLERYKIPYHDIHFGKPWADIYVDDLAVNANLDTMREIGWLLEEPNLSAPGFEGNTKGMIAARDFNTIQIIGDKVIKSSKSENIIGELYFYSHLPPQLSEIFPTVYQVNYLPETSTYTITMENRKGVTFSHLLVGRSITKGRLLTFLTTLHKIHSTPNFDTNAPSLNISPPLAEKFASHSLEAVNGRINIYANYSSKLRSRYQIYADRYDSLGPLAANLFNRLNEFLDTYEAEEKGVYGQVIHGDPVFSNAILSKDEKLVSFIDVRCQLDSTLTPEGDIHYDLAKVLQSLMGYDHILFMSANYHVISLDTPPFDEADQDLLSDLQEVFWDFLETTYEMRIHKKTLLRITASLFFSLIPLHKPELGAVFLRMCQNTLDAANRIEYGLGTSSLAGRPVSSNPGLMA